MSDRRNAQWTRGRISAGRPPGSAKGTRASYGSAYQAVGPTQYFGLTTAQALYPTDPTTPSTPVTLLAATSAITSGTPITLTGSGTAGNPVCVAIGMNPADSVTSVVDSKGNVYVPAGTLTTQAGARVQSIYYCLNPLALVSGVDTITVTTASNNIGAVVMLSMPGVVRFAGYQTQIGTGATYSATSSQFDRLGNMVVVCFAHCGSGGISLLSPFTSVSNPASRNVGYCIDTAGAPLTAAGVLAGGSGNWGVSFTAFATNFPIPASASLAEVKTIVNALSASSGSAASLSRSIRKQLLVSSTSVVSLAKAMVKFLSVSAGSSPSLTPVRQGSTFTQSLTATSVETASLSKAMTKAMAATAGSSPSLLKTMLRSMTASGGSSAALAKQIGKILNAPDPFGTPTNQGIKQTATVTSLSINTARDINVGELIEVFHACGTTGRVVASIVDPLANNYQAAQSNSASPVGEHYYARSTGFIAAGSAITVNFTGGTATHGIEVISCPMDPNVTLGVLVIAAATLWTTVNSVGPINSPVSPALANLFVLSLQSNTSFGGTPVESGTANLNLINGSNATLPLWIFAGKNIGSASLTAAGSWPTNNTGRAMLIVFYGYDPATATLMNRINRNLSVISPGLATLTSRITRTMIGIAGSAPSLSKAILKPLIASCSGTGFLSRTAAKALQIASNGVPSLSKRIGKSLGAITTGVATLLAQKAGNSVNLSASAGSSASLIKQVGKILGVAASGTGSMSRAQAKAMTAQAGSQATLSMRIAKTLLATSVITAFLIKRIGKGMNASAGSSTSLAESKVKGQTLTATAGSSASLRRSILKTLIAICTPSPSLNRMIARTLSVVSNGIASLVKRSGHLLAALAPGSATLDKQIGKSIPSTAGSVASLKSVPAKTLATTSTGVPTLSMLLRKVLATASPVVAILNRQLPVTMAVVVAGVASLIHSGTIRSVSLSAISNSVASLFMRRPIAVVTRWARFAARRIRLIAFAVPPQVLAVGSRRVRYLAVDADPRFCLGARRIRYSTMTDISMAQAQPQFPPIDASVEQEYFTFDFGFALSEGAFVQSVAAVNCTNAANTMSKDPDPQSRVLGSSAIANAPPPPAGSGVENAAVIQKLGNMVGGATYVVQCVVNTSDGQKLSLWAYVACITPQ